MFFTRLFIHLKRFIKNPIYIIAVLLMPVLAAWFVLCYRVSPTNINVAVFANGEYGKQTINSLINKDSSVSYITCQSEDELKNTVIKGDAECGYIFNDRYEKAFESGETDSLKKSIICVKSSSTVLNSVLNELILSSVSDLYCNVIAQNSADNLGIKTDITDLYTDYLNGDAVFRAEITTVDGDKTTTQATDNGQKIFMGLLALYILLGGVLGAITSVADEKKGISKGNFECIFSAVLIMSVVAEIITVFVYGFNSLHLIVLLVYVFAVSGYANVLRAVQSRSILCGMLPLLVLGATVFSNIIFNIGKLLPIAEIIGWIFPSAWYMSALNGNILLLLLLAVIVNVFGFTVNKIRDLV